MSEFCWSSIHSTSRVRMFMHYLFFGIIHDHYLYRSPDDGRAKSGIHVGLRGLRDDGQRVCKGMGQLEDAILFLLAGLAER